MVDVRGERFVELYAAESREHLELLTRSLLRMERGEPGVEEAFRAAHTVKGLAAAMSHDIVAEAAHRLEDRLSAVRDGSLEVSTPLIDELLDGADRLGQAIRDALAGTPARNVAAPAASTPAAVPAAADVAVPAGAAWEMVVRISADAALPAARAALIRKTLSDRPGVRGMWPGSGEPVDREVRIFLDDRADRDAVEKAVRACGDVDEVHVRVAGTAVSRVAPRPDEAIGSVQTNATVRVDRSRLDELAEGIAELSVLYARAAQTGGSVAGTRAAGLLAALQRAVLDMRMVPVSTAFERFPRLVRDTARVAGREVDFELEGGDIELDQAVLDALIDPLIHLLRNAVDHGIERPEVRLTRGKPRRGTLTLETTRERNSVRIRVGDDGAGVSHARVARRAMDLGLLSGDGPEPTEEEVFRLMFQPGFSTAEEVSELSGRGVGLDVVGARIRGLGGAIEMTTEEGKGTTFTLRVPITLALTHALRIRLGEEEYGLPITHVAEVATLDDRAAEEGAVRLRGETIPLVDLGRVLGSGGGSPTAVVIAGLGERRIALGVDRVVGHEQILVKAFDAPARMLPVFSGATLLPDGRPALLIDPLSVL
jgi:two-component system, chemotaxis family, sensor kinase CheA